MREDGAGSGVAVCPLLVVVLLRLRLLLLHLLLLHLLLHLLIGPAHGCQSGLWHRRRD